MCAAFQHPFEVIYGRNLLSPLELLKERWEGTKKEQFNVCKWVEELQNRLQTIREGMTERETTAKVKMKSVMTGMPNQENFRRFYGFTQGLLTIYVHCPFSAFSSQSNGSTKSTPPSFNLVYINLPSFSTPQSSLPIHVFYPGHPVCYQTSPTSIVIASGLFPSFVSCFCN